MTALLVATLVTAATALWLPPQRDRRVVALNGVHRATVVERLRPVATAAVARVGVGPASRRRRAQKRSHVIQALGVLAAELEAGAPPTHALLRAQGDPSLWPHAAGAARWGEGIAEALDRDALMNPVLSQVAACWRVAGRGAGLADSIQQIAESSRVAEDVRVEMESQLAGPRATARLLSVLPLVGLGFGIMLGADPLAWLLGAGPGRACLAAGLLLTAVGTWWTGRIALAVERRL